MNRQSRKKIITAEGSNAPKSTIILVFPHQRPIVRGANFLVTMPNRSMDQLLELNNIITKTRYSFDAIIRSPFHSLVVFVEGMEHFHVTEI